MYRVKNKQLVNLLRDLLELPTKTERDKRAAALIGFTLDELEGDQKEN